MYEHDTWYLAAKEEYRLEAFEIRALKRILKLNREEVTAEIRKLCNQELRDFYPSPNSLLIVK